MASKTRETSTHLVTVRITSKQRVKLDRLKEATGATTAELFRECVLQEKPVSKVMAKLRRNAARWTSAELDDGVLGWLVEVQKGRPSAPLGELLALCDSSGVLLGRVAPSLHRLEGAGRLKLRRGDLAQVGTAFHRWLPTDQRDRVYAAASAL